jgi:hypothetical protein
MDTLERLLSEHPFFKDLDPRYIQLIARMRSRGHVQGGGVHLS